MSITLDYLSTLRYDDNLGLDRPSLGSTTRWENSLSLGVVNQTPDSTLTFDLSGLHRFSDQPTFGSDAEFDNPTARLTYSKDSANSRISGLAEYQENNLAFTNQALTDINQDGVIDAADIITDRGTRIRKRANLTWQTGINDPLGFIFSYDRRERDYRSTTNPNLFKNQSDDYSLTTLLRISPILQGNITLNYTDYSAEDAARTDRQTTTLTTGFVYDVSPVTTVSANVGMTQIDETLRAVPVSTSDEDFVANFSWTRALSNGTANAQIDHAFGTNGDRTSAQAGRSLLFPNGSLNFNLGLTHGPFGETTPIGDISYTHTLSTSQITASLQRQVGTSIQSTETRSTLANLTYDYFINPVSSASFSVAYVDQKDEGTGPSNRRQRANFNASYTRALTRDWNATVGYQYSTDDTSTLGSADGNSLYLTLGRQFVLRP